jgi:hemerythrin-like domain-containing protein
MVPNVEAFVLMYQNHAAREDTIVFPAWKKNFSNKQLDEISDQFEEIEARCLERAASKMPRKRSAT